MREVITNEERRRVRSELARESVNKRWARLNAEQRREAVRPANEARRKQKRTIVPVPRGTEELDQLQALL